MLSPAQISEKLSSHRDSTLQFFSQLDETQQNAQIYPEPGGWRTADILTHLALSEERFLSLFQGILAGEGGVSADFDIDRYNAESLQTAQTATWAERMAQFKQARNALIAFSQSLIAEDLLKEARHPFLGVVPLEKMLKMLYRHALLHEADIAKALGLGKR
ncbi:MAG TPA: DinB family protein [Anaerolineales bacterium]|nr:DinB family protein [Anaerolineales bacterium]